MVLLLKIHQQNDVLSSGSSLLSLEVARHLANLVDTCMQFPMFPDQK